jgi:hypothetical protein
MSSSGADRRSSLEQALRVQAGALKLVSVELERVAALGAQTSAAAQMHALWLVHHQAVLDIHVAETLFALGESSGVASRLFQRLLPARSGTERRQSLEWLQDAQRHAAHVVTALADPSAPKPTLPTEESPVLANRWTVGSHALFASRILRDALRLQQAARAMEQTLAP